jgi:NAD(P)-dependent dehydrogenase (short-subunit alcohol dehydrogenase family)
MRSILVTGCSVGFGRQIALHLAEQNFTVYATMRNLSRSAPLEEEAARRNLKLHLLPLDITVPKSIESAVQTIIAEQGNLHGVVCNAGLLLRGFFEDLTGAEIRELFETNFFGTVAVVRAVLPHMRRARQGRIVIISSVAGRIGSPSGSAYSASRFAQEGFAESLRQEVEPLGIYVGLVEPGIVKTESWTTDKGAGSRTGDINSPYYHWFQQAERLFGRTMDSSPITTQDVANAVARAITDEYPRWRYMVGWRPKLVVTLRRYLPNETFERLYFRGLMRRITQASPGP